MKFLVTGANGFIGTSLVGQLSLLNHKVEVFTRSDKVETYTDTKFDGVINCAASIHNENLSPTLLARKCMENIYENSNL